jgi:uncharacterized protein YjbI with pentapeptide repeats
MRITMIAVCAVMTVLALSVFPQLVRGADPTDLKTFYNTHRCRGCDLSNLSLSNVIFPGLDVKGANMKGSILAYGKFTGSDFRKVDFTGANLVYANFSGANLRKANFTNVMAAGADFTGAVWTNGKRCLQGSIGMCKQ